MGSIDLTLLEILHSVRERKKLFGDVCDPIYCTGGFELQNSEGDHET